MSQYPEMVILYNLHEKLYFRFKGAHIGYLNQAFKINNNHTTIPISGGLELRRSGFVAYYFVKELIIWKLTNNKLEVIAEAQSSIHEY